MIETLTAKSAQELAHLKEKLVAFTSTAKLLAYSASVTITTFAGSNMGSFGGVISNGWHSCPNLINIFIKMRIKEDLRRQTHL